MAFFGALHRAAQRPVPEPWAHGAYRRRRREGCLLALSSSQWRCFDIGVSHTLTNFLTAPTPSRAPGARRCVSCIWTQGGGMT
eukprot:9281373-Pyramimonas_sp.AAC.1